MSRRNLYITALVGAVAWAVLAPGSSAAATYDVPQVGRQALADLDVLLAGLVSECGPVLSRELDGDIERLTLERCDVETEGARGRIYVDVQATRSWGLSSLSADEITRRSGLDVKLLEALGFDPFEMGNVETLAFAGQDRDEVSGEVGAARIMGSKSFGERALDGVPVEGNRAVVTRDYEGRVVRITAAWPTIDEGAVIATSGTLAMTEADASALTDLPVVAAEPVLVLGMILDGTVRDGAICTQVLVELAGPEGSTKISGFYVIDGLRWDSRARAGR